MFDAQSAEILRSAPDLPGLNAEGLPELLTRHYAGLVSERLRGEVQRVAASSGEGHWTLGAIADSYEIIASVQSDARLRRAAAFVAGTAQQILSRRQRWSGEVATDELINRDRVDPSLSAVLLFLAAEQFADASEAAREINLNSVSGVSAALSTSICMLGLGKLDPAIGSVLESDALIGGSLQDRAVELLLRELLQGVNELSNFLLAPSANSAAVLEKIRQRFLLVLRLASQTSNFEGNELSLRPSGAYPGIRHLASLLLGAEQALTESALSLVPPPHGAKIEFWSKWISGRARRFPYIWPNHREFVEKGFYQIGRSAVLVLPTGAGKTTVSSLKIAGVLASGKRAIFIAPTHALVEQMTEDLQEMFPKEVLGWQVLSDADISGEEGKRPEIEVMTPEGCLAALCFDPSRFEDVGLLVFDECHLLSPGLGKIRRSLDGMLCLLSFRRAVPDADYLFLSAMLLNGEEFSEWIASLTGRDCVFVSLLWKPSRQARGVVVYDSQEIHAATALAAKTQTTIDKSRGKKAKELRTKAAERLAVKPFAIWGLRHNWLDVANRTAAHTRRQLLDRVVPLRGRLNYGAIQLLPNVNDVSAEIAVGAAKAGLKTIVFVNNKSHSVSTARTISMALPDISAETEAEQERWLGLEEELGSLRHSVLRKGASAVPHNAAMLRLERDLAERMYQRADGAKVIVATPTLAQGLNLPAHLAVLAGDKRTNADGGGRSDLEAHEILNAAARAGRAGHLANGIVLLVPDPVLATTYKGRLPADVVSKLQAILPEDDRCVTIVDPLQIVLDRLFVTGSDDRDVQYTVNRMVAFRTLEDGASDTDVIFEIGASFSAFQAKRRGDSAEYERRVEMLRTEVERATPGVVDNVVVRVAAKSGLPIAVVDLLSKRLQEGVDSLPQSIVGWLGWVFEWLELDRECADELLRDVSASINAAVGVSKQSDFDIESLNKIKAGAVGWLEGKNLAEIESLLGGDPNSNLPTKSVCPRARELVGTVMPRGIAYVMSLVAMMIHSMGIESVPTDVLDSISIATRRGFDSPQKVRFAAQNPSIRSRVQIHRHYANAVMSADEFWIQGSSP